MTRASSWVLFGLLGCSCTSGETQPAVVASRDDAGTSCAGRGQTLAGLALSAPLEDGRDIVAVFVEGEPRTPVVGNNSWVFRFEVEGQSVQDVAPFITVTPWMPDHAHGTPTLVRVAEEEPGVYRFEPIHTRMPGYWEIEIDVHSADLQTRLRFGVCVD